MRVIIVADYAVAQGGAPQVAIASAQGLADLGHEVVYVQGVGQEGDASLDAHPGIRRVTLGGEDVWSKSLLRAARDGVWNAGHLAQLGDLLASLAGPQTVVHVHQWTKFFSPSLFASVRRSGLPMAVSMHDYFLACPIGLMYRVDKDEPCGLTPLSLKCLAAPCDPRTHAHKALRALRALAVNHALRGQRFSAVHVSQTGLDTIGRLLPPGADHFVLENPIDCVDMGPRVNAPGRKVVYCGRLTQDKGADLVASAALAAGLPSLFIGEGPMRERILEIDPGAEITGWLDKSQARRRIAQDALVLVAPSRWPETGPLVAAEAMAAGVPVVVSERAGARSRVADGANGYVAAPNADAIAQALRKVAEPGESQRLGDEAYRRFWADPSSLRAHSTKLADIYRATLANSEGSSSFQSSQPSPEAKMSPSSSITA
ncbi:MAG: glycosyl transferase family 1 [Hyphomicrobiales bacterium]|nr:glycosyl transferase family 1 [Hyphomicrobiales bacterium]